MERMMRNSIVAVTIAWAVLLVELPRAWNATGHQVVARIAWDNMTPGARRNAIALLQSAPVGACLRELFSTDPRPPEIRQREFFMRASTWPDIVRPHDASDTRPCTKFHRRDWHFINFFWQGISGATNADRPRDRTDVDVPELNAVERLAILRPLVVCAAAACGTQPGDRATALAWVLHLVGDIHQPLHTSARVTTRPDEQRGDQGGNLFKLETTSTPLSLHGFWDGIVDRSMRQGGSEPESVYLNRVATAIMKKHPRAQLANRIRSGEFAAWAREGFDTTKQRVYPVSLQRGRLPNEEYRTAAFTSSEQAIALAGYRLGDLLNRMLP